MISVDYQLSVKMFFVVIRSLKKAERMSQYRVSRSTTIAVQTKKKKKENSYLYRDCKLFLSKDGFEVVKIDYGIASIPSFR